MAIDQRCEVSGQGYRPVVNDDVCDVYCVANDEPGKHASKHTKKEIFRARRKRAKIGLTVKRALIAFC